jgi:hypothetical protein
VSTCESRQLLHGCKVLADVTAAMCPHLVLFALCVNSNEHNNPANVCVADDESMPVPAVRVDSRTILPHFLPGSAAAVCKPGFWYQCISGTCTCEPCNKAMFCPGGWPQLKNYGAAKDKGERYSCQEATVVPAGSTTITTPVIEFNGLTTKSNRATRPQDCVPMPGFFLSATSRATQKAALCPANTYSVGFGRVRQCLRCQSGTEENPDSAYNNTLPTVVTDPVKLRINRLEVCRE